jgi:hypothetical protein
MQRRIDRMYCQEIVRAATCRCAVPGKPHRPFNEAGEDGAEIKAASPERK